MYTVNMNKRDERNKKAADLRIKVLEMGCMSLKGDGYLYHIVADALKHYGQDDAAFGWHATDGRRELVKKAIDTAHSLANHDLNRQLSSLWGLASN
jgi:predicted metal-dependent hydrolase